MDAAFQMHNGYGIIGNIVVGNKRFFIGKNGHDPKPFAIWEVPNDSSDGSRPHEKFKRFTKYETAIKDLRKRMKKEIEPKKRKGRKDRRQLLQDTFPTVCPRSQRLRGLPAGKRTGAAKDTDPHQPEEGDTALLYVNSLGGYEPAVAVGLIGATDYVGGKFVVSTGAVNNPNEGRWWPNQDGAVAQIMRWAEENGYDLVGTSRTYQNQPEDKYFSGRFEHRETKKAKVLQKEKQAKKFEHAEPGFVRFGDLPEDGRSRNRATGACEVGVSVFRAEFAKDGSYRPIIRTPQEEISYLMLLCDDRPVYRVWGEVLGQGGDGEPVLKITDAKRIVHDEHVSRPRERG